MADEDEGNIGSSGGLSARAAVSSVSSEVGVCGGKSDVDEATEERVLALVRMEENIDLRVEPERVAGNSDCKVWEGEDGSDDSGAAVEVAKLDSKGSDKVDDAPSLRTVFVFVLDPCGMGCGDESRRRFWSLDGPRFRKLAVSAAVADTSPVGCRLVVKDDA